MRTFVDRGGTFTDIVHLHEDGRVELEKVPSDRAVVGALARGPLTFGTTVATNALLERKGVSVLLVVTRGFSDLPWIGNQARPELFDPDTRWPEPLLARVVEISGRIGPEGEELEPLDAAELAALPDYVQGIDSIAVVLVGSHKNPAHELLVGEVIERDTGRLAALGHRVSPELGFLARVETTLVDAAITPVLAAALERDQIPEGALAMRSDGSLCPAGQLRAPDAVLSGPAGGVLAVAALAEAAGFDRAVGLDMGGTSTDVCRVDAGQVPRREGEMFVAGVRLRRPILDVETIAAGGGSILGRTDRRLTVGPESAGADPGPACYGRGGPATVTDAALLTGLLDPDAFDPPLDRAAAEAALSPLGDPAEFLEIAREKMAQAVQRLAIQRGVSLEDHALVAYGGAAGQHAAKVAERLGIRAVLIHPCASVFCAFGQALARREETALAAIWGPLDDWDTIEKVWQDLEATLPYLGATERSLELRYRGTDHPIEVAVAEGGGPEDAAQALSAAHRQRYGFDKRDPVEVVNARVRVRAPATPMPVVTDDVFGLGEPGQPVTGPTLLKTATTSVEVPRGWTAVRVGPGGPDEGVVRLEREDAPPAPLPEARTPFAVELWSNRFQAVAEEAGTVLQRVARSVNIRERLDFSCALFDGQGLLVANAPHIPVHLGAMGETVRDLLEQFPDPPPGQSWLSNDPRAGGSHLPDLTVVTALAAGGKRFFVASRAHHVDVGGLTPGSMPPHSTSLAEEGLVVRGLQLLEDDLSGLRSDAIRETLVAGGCREPETVLADLEAQLAANTHGARRLLELGPPELLTAWMGHLADVAEEATRAVIARLAPGYARDEIAGVPLVVTLEPDLDQGRLRVDFTGTGGPHPGNLNAPKAVVRAAVLYTLRVLAGRALPLNDGALRRVDLVLPAPSILAPGDDAAVVGGNVETSQRLVDLLMRAAGARAASAGTMNNLTLGGAAGSGQRWSVYETIGGGLGASSTHDGAPGRQIHMTNTRATDVEVMEARLPVLLRRFSYRPGSGGQGDKRGGDGLIREIEVRAPASASLLATRRQRGPQGLEGGGPGAPGVDEICLRGRWQPWDGQVVELEPGDRVRVATPGGGGYGCPPETS